MNNMMEQFEKFMQKPEAAPEAPAAEPIEYVDNVIYVDFQKRCRITK